MAKNDWKGILPLAFPLLFIPIGVVAFVVGTSSSAGASQTGGSRAQSIDPSPSSPIKSQLDEYIRLSNKDLYLQQNTNKLADLAKILRDFRDSKLDTDPAYKDLSGDTKQKIKDETNQSLIQIEAITGDTTIGKKIALEAYTKLQESLAKISSYSTGISGNASTAVALAKDVISKNVNNSHPYVWGAMQVENNELLASDCSGFITFLMNRSGVFPKAVAHVYGRDYYYEYAQHNRFFKVVKTEQELADVDYATVKQWTDNGTVQPGDIFISINNKEQGHIYMYIGGAENQNIAHSSTNKGVSGPQYSSLTARVNPKYRRQIAIVRPLYPS